MRDGCWGWQGGKKAYGYPQIAQSRSRKARLNGTAGYAPLGGHRVSWELHYGPIPEGQFVLHKCDNTECTNPEHLYLGTQSDNMHDAWTRGRRKPKRHYDSEGRILCKRGHIKELLPNETDKYVCRICMKNWRHRNPEKYAAGEARRKERKREKINLE